MTLLICSKLIIPILFPEFVEFSFSKKIFHHLNTSDAVLVDRSDAGMLSYRQDSSD